MTNIAQLYLYEVPRINKFIETENRTEVTGGYGEQERENNGFISTEFLLEMMKSL